MTSNVVESLNIALKEVCKFPAYMSHDINFSKEMFPKEHQEKELISRIHYTSAIGCIMYVIDMNLTHM